MTSPLTLESEIRTRHGRSLRSLMVSIVLVVLAGFSLLLSAAVEAASAYRVSMPIVFSSYSSTPGGPPGSGYITNAPDPYSLPADGLANPDAVREEAFVGPAASAYRFVAKTAQDRNRALYCLTAAIYYEAASESVQGQRGVAQVVLNRVRHPSFPASVCGVVFQGSSRNTGCQFSFACDGSMARRPSAAAWTRASGVAGAALSGSTFPSVGLATHYHTQAIWPRWGKSLVMTNVVGAHIFHRWRGRYGEPAAFHQRYAGIEPAPGPYRPVSEQVGTAPAAVVHVRDVAAMPPPIGPVRSAQSVPQNTRQQETASTSDYRDPALARSGQVRDDYQSSGQWIAN